MAVPKKRTGHSAQGHRRSNWKASKPELTKCQKCGEAVLAHTVCTACGTYKGEPVRLKDKSEAVVVEEKKPAKKSKKAEKTVEKAEEVKVSETQAVSEDKTSAENTVEAQAETVETPAETDNNEKE